MNVAIIKMSEVAAAKWSAGPALDGAFHTFIATIGEITIYAIMIHVDEESEKAAMVFSPDGSSMPILGSIAEMIYDAASNAFRATAN